MLTALDLAGIPVHAADRDESDPVVIAGGHAAFNPETIADFIDAAVVGDGEEAVLLVTDLVGAWKREGRPGGRVELLERLARTGVVYVPRFYDVSYLPDGRIQRIAPNAPGIPWRVAKHTVMDLDAWPYPKAPLVPLAESVHERMSVEIFRGCTRGCRFCQAGMITRPVRERSITGVGEMIERGLAATGFEEVGLLSLSSADHSEIAPMTKGLADRYAGEQVGLSLPSTRVDAFNIDLANELTRNGRRSGLTFAPEGGSERIRKVINKMVSEDDLIRTVAAAYGAGWRQVKLYFMCGLPTETDEDVLQIADLARRVIETGREVSGRRDIRCTVSIGGFVPKPHTPFQWAGQLSAEETDARLLALRDSIRADRRYGSSIGFRYHDGKPGIIEGLLSRGDRRVGRVIEAVWRDGGRFDGWSEHFSYERWAACAERELAAFFGKPAALVFPTGYQTNLGAISALVGRADVVISDKQNHASIVDACRLSFGATRRFAHNDMDDLEQQLRACAPGAGKLVVVDGVFSMEGTIAPLPAIVALCERYGARLLVDDAHGCGVLAGGRGTAAHFGLTDRVDLITITFSKAFASIGGAVLGDETVISYIQHHARSLIFSASTSPANTAAAYAALQIMRDEPEHSARVLQNAARMRAGLRALGYDIGQSETPIVPIRVGERDLTFALWRALLDAGLFTNPIAPPAAPVGMLRTSYMAIHTDALLDQVLTMYANVGRKLGVIPREHEQSVNG
jgi:radical SAM family uncharacterized protein